MKKRILSAFLVLCMMLTMVPTAALAAEDPGGGNGSDRVHTESNDGVVVDKTVNYDEDGNYSLTLEAYVTNEVTKGSKTTPLDLSLIHISPVSCFYCTRWSVRKPYAFRSILKDFPCFSPAFHKSGQPVCPCPLCW